MCHSVCEKVKFEVESPWLFIAVIQTVLAGFRQCCCSRREEIEALPRRTSVQQAVLVESQRTQTVHTLWTVSTTSQVLISVSGCVFVKKVRLIFVSHIQQKKKTTYGFIYSLHYVKKAKCAGPEWKLTVIKLMLLTSQWPFPKA